MYSTLANATYSVAVNPLTGHRSHRLDYTDPKGVPRAVVVSEKILPIGTPASDVLAYFKQKPAEKSKSAPRPSSLDAAIAFG